MITWDKYEINVRLHVLTITLDKWIEQIFKYVASIFSLACSHFRHTIDQHICDLQKHIDWVLGKEINYMRNKIRES